MRERSAASADEYPIVPSPTAPLRGHALGIDIGGTGIKAGVVDLATGLLATDRIREPTPRPAKPAAVIDVVAELVGHLEATGKLTADMPGGAGFPSVMRAGRALTTTHGDPSWIGVSVQGMLEQQRRWPLGLCATQSRICGVVRAAWPIGPRL